ncbi:MAG TPA: G1 family glutamic endopeptidase [Gaiellaceae bacterium]|nr:G1 family glutamic endopeptidase [Gaiellaceae bacterium]
MRTLAVLAIAVTGLVLAGAAQARVAQDADQSTNWAGYAVSGSTFTDVKGTWVQPAAACTGVFTSSYSAFWVGIGGLVGSNGGLEQTGTESDCRNGQPFYTAWYELLPDGSVSVPVTISAGDTISAEVSIDGAAVTLTLTDVTTNQMFTTQETPAVLDTSSAEWIAEAPSRCFSTDHCAQLPLANFGTIEFSGSSTTANGHVGTISDQSWSATSIELGGETGSASPAALSPDGSDFTVAFVPVQVTQPQVRAKPKVKVKAKVKAKPKPRHRHHRASP